MFLTPRGHALFGAIWALAMLIMVIGFSVVGGLVYLPWLLLLVPFIGLRLALARDDLRRAILRTAFQCANAVTELAMIVIFVYLYNLAVLSFCPPPR